MKIRKWLSFMQRHNYIKYFLIGSGWSFYEELSCGALCSLNEKGKKGSELGGVSFEGIKIKILKGCMKLNEK